MAAQSLVPQVTQAFLVLQFTHSRYTSKVKNSLTELTCRKNSVLYLLCKLQYYSVYSTIVFYNDTALHEDFCLNIYSNKSYNSLLTQPLLPSCKYIWIYKHLHYFSTTYSGRQAATTDHITVFIQDSLKLTCSIN